MKRPAPIITSELEKMTTPERIDKMMALKAERDTEMTNRMIASKTFYGSLTPTQQKVFDTHTQNFLHTSQWITSQKCALNLKIIHKQMGSFVNVQRCG